LKIVTIYRDTKSYDSTIVEVTTIAIVTIPQIIVFFALIALKSNEPPFVICFFLFELYGYVYALLDSRASASAH